MGTIMTAPRKPKAEAPPPKTPRKTMPVQVATDIAYMCGVIAAHDEVTVGTLLNDYLRPYVETNYRRVLAEISERVKKLDEAG
jgi:hypothetical protein